MDENLSSALSDFGVQEAWARLPEALQDEAMTWLGRVGGGTRPARLIAQMVSAGRPPTTKTLEARTPRELRDSVAHHEERDVGRSLVECAKAELTGADHPVHDGHALVRLWGAGLVPQIALGREAEGHGSTAVGSRSRLVAADAAVAELLQSPRMLTDDLAQVVGRNDILAAAVAYHPAPHEGVVLVTLESVAFVPLPRSGGVGFWLGLRGPVAIELSRDWKGSRLRLATPEVEETVLVLNALDAIRLALRVRHAAALRTGAAASYVDSLLADLDDAERRGLIDPVAADQGRHHLLAAREASD